MGEKEELKIGRRFHVRKAVWWTRLYAVYNIYGAGYRRLFYIMLALCPKRSTEFPSISSPNGSPHIVLVPIADQVTIFTIFIQVYLPGQDAMLQVKRLPVPGMTH
jgi:hypothetical protein